MIVEIAVVLTEIHSFVVYVNVWSRLCFYNFRDNVFRDAGTLKTKGSVLFTCWARGPSTSGRAPAYAQVHVVEFLDAFGNISAGSTRSLWGSLHQILLDIRSYCRVVRKGCFSG